MKTRFKHAVTRIVRSKGLNAGKLAQLAELARRLGGVRKHVWHKYGSVNGASKSAIDARDAMQEVGDDFNVTRRLRKATTLDVMGDIAAYRESCKVQVKRAIFERTDDKDEQQRLFTLLKSDQWASDKYLSRKMRRAYRHDAAAKKIIYTAVHRIVDKAKLIGVEDLTAVIKSTKRIGKDGKRRLSGWVKGLMAEAITNVSHRRCSSVRLVCSAYSSQECRNCGCLGTRSGDIFHCDICRVDTQADWNAAGTVLNRIADPEIDRYMPYREVKLLLLARTALRVGLLTLDPSCGAVPSTGSELHDLFSRATVGRKT